VSHQVIWWNNSYLYFILAVRKQTKENRGIPDALDEDAFIRAVVNCNPTANNNISRLT